MEQSILEILNESKGKIKNKTFNQPIVLDLSEVEIGFPFTMVFENVTFNDNFRIFNKEEDKEHDIQFSLELETVISKKMNSI